MTVSGPPLSPGRVLRCRETPLHQLYSSAFSKQKLQDSSTKKPALPFGDLPTGYHYLHTQIQYECISPFYRRLGSSRRTCLRTGKWSGRAPSCIPSESMPVLGLEQLRSPIAAYEKPLTPLKTSLGKTPCPKERPSNTFPSLVKSEIPQLELPSFGLNLLPRRNELVKL